MANDSHSLKFGTTAHSSADGAVAPAPSACADQPTRTEAADGLGLSAADDVDGCNCSRYETCDFCRWADDDADALNEDDDATLDSFYRTLGGLKGCE